MKDWNTAARIFAVCGAASAVGAVSAIGSGCSVLVDNTGNSAPNAAPLAGASATPNVGQVVTLASPPPPISGGTLAIAPNGYTAVASDPDRDKIYIVDLGSRSIINTLQLSPHDEPGRIVFDDQGHAYVALRGANTLLTLTIATGAMLRRAACIAPRGVAFDKSQETIVLACADGHLMRFPAAMGDATANTWIEQDLRDVIVRQDGSLVVSTFRNADILSLDSSFAVTARGSGLGVRNLAWRTFELGTDRAHESTVLVAQMPQPIAPGPAYYSPPPELCGLVPTLIDIFDAAGNSYSLNLPAVLPVDAVADAKSIALLSTGNGHSPGAPQVYIQALPTTPNDSDDSDPLPFGTETAPSCTQATGGSTMTTPGQPTAIAIDGAGELIIQSREPAAIYIVGPERTRVMATINLGGDTREDTGHAIFHSNSGANVACASCHAEGGEDAHVWVFPDIDGGRKTPSLRGTISGTAPYHWDGSQKDMTDIMHNVFEQRMSGPVLDPSQINATANWVFAIPPPPALNSASAASARGAALFAARGCTNCHSGTKYTNNQSENVDTGGTFQVPSLIGVAWRAPYVHDGRYSTLTNRFAQDKSAQHGSLTADQIQDLVAFLETL